MANDLGLFISFFLVNHLSAGLTQQQQQDASGSNRNRKQFH